MSVQEQRLQAALSLAEIGFAIVPIPEGQKAPNLPEWQRLASRDPQQVSDWLHHGQYGVFPLAGSRLLVVDVDDPAALAGFPRLPPTLIVDTAKGQHIYGRLPDGVEEEDVPRSFAGGEVRVAGSGQVVGPWSQHPTGAVYTPRNGTDVLELSRDWLAALRRSHEARTKAQHAAWGPKDPGWVVTEPGRHDFLLSRCRNLRGTGLTAANLRREIDRLNRERCRPPKSDDEVEAIVAWVEANIADDPPPIADAEPIIYGDLAEVLDATVVHLRRFIRFSDPAQAIAIALWVAHTHVYDRADTSPILWIRSAVAASGKTKVFETIEHLVPRPWVCERPSEAVVYRKIDRDRPTMLVDEIDTILSDRSGSFEGLRAIFNAGNRPGTVISRALEAGKALTDFDIYCPKAVAGLGTIPDTMVTRSIPIYLQRRAQHEKIERLRRRKARDLGTPLRTALAHHVRQVEVLHLDDEALPRELSDRQQDSWESLLAIADAAGGEWPEQARKAAVVLHVGADADEESWGLRLLADTRAIFTESGEDWIKTADLIGKLEKIEESPWGDIKGKPITPHYLAKLLKDFKIEPKQTREGADKARRYYARDFTDAWSRYLTAYPAESGTSGTSGAANVLSVPVAPVVPVNPNTGETTTDELPFNDQAAAAQTFMGWRPRRIEETA